ncbi:DUF3253 domain-containing protein [Aurantimonas marina]|uniref:DUF3253 domain-containing protein n=1 Tax=Aurantimonas marina TaxID=2780508 RepID=UPI001AEEEC3F|nr:DUF3253 domain-containing protein [Aurantimonas marina]
MTDAPAPFAKPNSAAIINAIEAAIASRGDSKSVCPSEVARALVGSDEKLWRQLMKPIRAEAVKLADAGRLEIRRKGKTVNPRDFRGVYRLAAPRSADD